MACVPASRAWRSDRGPARASIPQQRAGTAEKVEVVAPTPALPLGNYYRTCMLATRFMAGVFQMADRISCVIRRGALGELRC